MIDLAKEAWHVEPGTAAAIVDKDRTLIATVANYGDDKESIAIGRILAAAPKMLSVLKQIVSALNGNCSGEYLRGELSEIARDIIAQAEKK